MPESTDYGHEVLAVPAPPMSATMFTAFLWMTRAVSSNRRLRCQHNQKITTGKFSCVQMRGSGPNLSEFFAMGRIQSLLRGKSKMRDTVDVLGTARVPATTDCAISAGAFS